MNPDPNESLFRQFVGKLATDSLRYLPAALVPAALSLAGVAVFTRMFDAGDYGRYALVIAVTTIVASILSGWVQQSVLRYFPRYDAEGRRAEFVSNLLSSLAAVAAALVAVCGLFFVLSRGRLGGYAPFYWPAVVLVVAETAFLGINSTFQAALRSEAYARHKIAVSALRLVLALAIVFFIRRHVVGLVAGAALAYLLLVPPMVALLARWRRDRALFSRIDWGFIRMLAGYGLPMVGWMLGGQVLAVSDRFVIGLFRGSAEVGIYSANYNLVSMGLGLVASPLLMAAHPIVMNAWEKGECDRVPALVSAFSRYYLMAIVPVVVVVAVFSSEIATLMLGPDFRPGHTIAPLILVGIALWNMAMYGHKGLELRERSGIMLVLVSVAATANIGLNFLVVPAHGYQGAAATTLASYALYPVMVFFVSRRHIAWRVPWRSVGRVLLASAVMGGAAIGLKAVIEPRLTALGRAGVSAAAAVVVYGFVLVLSGEITGYERRVLSAWRMRR